MATGDKRIISSFFFIAMGCSPSSTDSIVPAEDNLTRNTFVVWLNSSPDSNSVQQLRQSFPNVKIFHSSDKCFQFLNQLQTEKVFLILSNVVTQSERSQFEKHPSIVSISSSFESISSLKQSIEFTERSFVSLTILPSIVLTDIDVEDLSFLFFCIFKQSIETTDIRSNKNYNPSKIVEFYLENSAKLNRSFQTENLDYLFENYSLLRDLTKQIQRQTNQRIEKVYRAQSISPENLKKIQQNANGFICFNSFLTANSNFQSEYDLARENPTSILFEIETHSNNFIQSNETIIFSYFTIFQIKKLTKLKPNLLQINLISLDNHDERIQKLSADLQRTLPGSSPLSRLANFKLKTGAFNSSLSIYKILLSITPSTDSKMLAHIHNQLGYLFGELKQPKQAKFHYEKSIDFYLSYLPPFDPELSSSYSNLAVILKQEGDLDGALKYHQHALDIDLRAEPPNYEQIATRYNNIGVVHRTQEKFDQAMSFYQTALQIGSEHLPSTHPILATTLNNIADIHRIQQNYQTALEFYRKTLEIETKILAPNHPSLAVTYFNLAITFDWLDRTQEAIEFATKSYEINRLVFGDDHSEVEEKRTFIDSLKQRENK